MVAVGEHGLTDWKAWLPAVNAANLRPTLLDPAQCFMSSRRIPAGGGLNPCTRNVSRVRIEPVGIRRGIGELIASTKGLAIRDGRSFLATALVPDELPDNSRLRLATFADIPGISRRLATQRYPPCGRPLHG